MPIDNSYIAKDLTVKVKKDDVKLSTKPYVYKGDTGMIFEITVDNWNYYFDRSPNAEVDVFTSDCKAMIEIVRPDGKLTKLMDVPIVDNEIHFRINKNISDLVGIYKIFVKIMKGRVVIATIPPFDYEVKDKPYFNNILPMDRGFLQVEDESLLCYDTLDDYGIKHISELTKTDTEKDLDELILQQNGITTCITVGDFLKSTRDTSKNYTDTTATTIRGEVSDLDTEHKNLVDATKTELTELINSKDSSQSSALDTAKQELTELITQKDTAQTEALNLAKNELNQTITTKHTEAKEYTDTEVAKAKELSNSNLAEAKQYTDTKTLETLTNAKAYSDEKLVEAKGYADQKLVEANSHSDANLITAKGYTDTEINKAKVELKGYSDTNLETSKSYTNAEIVKVNNSATNNLAEAKKYADNKLIEGKTYSDQKIKDLVGLAPEDLDTLEEIGAFAKGNKELIDGFLAQLNSKSDKTHIHDIATDSTNGFMSKEDFTKLKGISEGANNYTHPKTHQASIIVQDATHRFVTDEDKTKWNKVYTYDASVSITNANDYKSLGIVKTSPDTTNLPSVCSGTSEKWGTIQFLKESPNGSTGTQIFCPVDGLYKGRLFTRAFCKNSWSEWKLASDFSGNYNDLINKPTPYTLPIASDTILGGIKLGIGFEKLEDGTVNVVSGGKADSVDWEGIIGVPSEFTPKQHTHTKSEITDLFAVENALTSNSTTNALSVAQGKAIDDKVNALRGEYDTTEGEVGTLKTDVTDLKGKAHTHANATELNKITDGKVASWDAKETTSGSQAKATKSLTDAKAYSDTKLNESKSYTDTKLVEAKKYADSKVNYGTYQIQYNSVQDSLDFIYTPKQ